MEDPGSDGGKEIRSTAIPETWCSDGSVAEHEMRSEWMFQYSRSRKKVLDKLATSLLDGVEIGCV